MAKAVKLELTKTWSPDPRRSSKKRNSALMKATQVLELVVSEDFGISASELAVRLKIPRQTAHRTVRALEEMGFLIRAVSREKYEIGPTLRQLANKIQISTYRRGPWRAILKQVVEQSGESCNVAVLDGDEIIYIDRVECRSPLRVQFEVGSHVPSFCTAIGKLLLAHLPHAARKKLLAQMPLHKLTEQSITDHRALETDLRMIRKQGYAINNGEFIRGIIAVAVPIYNENGEVIAGIAIHAPVLRSSVSALVRSLPILRKAAKQLSALHHIDARRSAARAN